jgi:hypothetical protein
VLRAAGEVGCAHCARMDATVECGVCTRLVCAACAADWASCFEPSGRILLLGRTARVSEVDPHGRVAVVTHWRKPVRLLNLRHVFWADDAEAPRRLFLMNRRVPPRMTSLRCLVYPDVVYLGDQVIFHGIRALDVYAGTTRTLQHIAEDVPDHGTAMSPVDDWYSYISVRQRVVVVPSGDLVQSYEPLPRKVVHAHAIDGERRLLASGSWQEIAIDKMDGPRLERVGYTRTTALGDVHWLGLAGGTIAAAVTEGTRGTAIEVRRVEGDLSVGVVVHEEAPRPSFRSAALSTDGRYLAYAFGASLTVVDLEQGTIERFDDHTDDINLVRFAREDHVLISADTDHRLVLRPRTPTGYTCPLILVSMAAG